MIDLVILTGVNGAGRSQAKQAFEEAGYFITDNFPLEVADKLFETFIKDSKKFKNVVLSVDLFMAKQVFIEAKKHSEFSVRFAGITCAEDIILERFKLTRKIHPLQSFGLSLSECIEKEIKIIRDLRDDFDVYIDTSKLKTNEFRSLIFETIINRKDKFTIVFSSFGYKISVPQDIETVFDVRLLPNPFWVPDLTNLTGLDKPIKDYVLKNEKTKQYLKRLVKYLDYYFDQMQKDGRNHANIGIACSGGQHRSVVIAEWLAKHYSKLYRVKIVHKDLIKRM